MKRLIYIIMLFLLLASSSFAQKYYSPPQLSKFSGTWEYSGNNEKFKAVMKIRKKYLKLLNIYMDVLEGYHSCINNGKVAQSSLGTGKPSLFSRSLIDKEKSSTKVHFLFYDLVKSKRGVLIIDFLPGKADQIWILTSTEGVRIGKYDYDFAVPLKMTLRKVE